MIFPREMLPCFLLLLLFFSRKFDLMIFFLREFMDYVSILYVHEWYLWLTVSLSFFFSLHLIFSVLFSAFSLIKFFLCVSFSLSVLQPLLSLPFPPSFSLYLSIFFPSLCPSHLPLSLHPSLPLFRYFSLLSNLSLSRECEMPWRLQRSPFWLETGSWHWSHTLVVK